MADTGTKTKICSPLMVIISVGLSNVISGSSVIIREGHPVNNTTISVQSIGSHVVVL